jgi:hypothetical protein
MAHENPETLASGRGAVLVQLPGHELRRCGDLAGRAGGARARKSRPVARARHLPRSERRDLMEPVGGATAPIPSPRA